MGERRLCKAEVAGSTPVSSTPRPEAHWQETNVIFTRILAATDGTEVALRGVEVAAQMAARDKAEFLLITAVSLPQHLVLSANVGQRSVYRVAERMAQESLAPALKVLERWGVGAEVKMVIGPPAESILTEIDASGADLVIMGRRSRMEPKDLILGDVSYRVARRVTVPILLVP